MPGTTDEELSKLTPAEIADQKLQSRMNKFTSQAPSIACMVPLLLGWALFFFLMCADVIIDEPVMGFLAALSGILAFGGAMACIFQTIRMMMDHAEALNERLVNAIKQSH